MKRKIDIILNLTIVLSTIWAVSAYFWGPPDFLGSHGVQCLKYFTTESNILAAAASALWLLCISRGQGRVPRWVTVFKFAAAAAVSVTLLTVIFFLAPMAAIRGKGLATALLFFRGNVFVLHLSTPVLAIACAVVLERDEPITVKQALLGVAPVGVYSLVYLTMVVIVGRWTDWYGFTFGGRLGLVPVVMAVMYGFTAALSYAGWKLRNR